LAYTSDTAAAIVLKDATVPREQKRLKDEDEEERA